MSYAIQVGVADDGTPVITGWSGTPPAGSFSINGHSDPNGETLGIYRYEGIMVASATAWYQVPAVPQPQQATIDQAMAEAEDPTAPAGTPNAGTGQDASGTAPASAEAPAPYSPAFGSL